MAARKSTATEEPVEEFIPDPKAKTIKVETGNAIYELMKPKGKLGALHFRLITKAMPKSIDPETNDISPADQDRRQEVFEQWIAEVLPEILISHDIDDLPGEDQWLLFLASFNTMNVRKDLFRIVA